MKRLLILSVLLSATMLAHGAQASEKIRYYQDPVWEAENKDEPHPMEDLIDLAKGGDVRAQFILADLYSKGKGGFSRSTSKARQWFEESARNGYSPAFIRLAAISRHRDEAVDAYKWYGLAAETGGDDGAYAAHARDAWAAEKQLNSDDIKQAKLRMADWKKAKAARDEELAEQEKLERRRAEIKEKDEKEKADAQARADAQAAKEKARADAVAEKEKARADAKAEKERARAQAEAEREQARKDREKAEADAESAKEKAKAARAKEKAADKDAARYEPQKTNN